MYTKYKLNELGSLSRGKSKHRPRNDEILYGGKYPFIQTGDVKKAKWKVKEYTQTYNEVGLAQSKLWGIDTLCITIAANIAETAILGIPACFPDSILGFIPNKEKANVYYISYAIRKYKEKLEKSATQTAQKNINLGTFESLELDIPSIDMQNDIVNEIIPYDEKILSNDQLINKLEEYTQLLFHKWFVDFNFPNEDGHPHKDYGGEMIEVDGKWIPKGWMKVPINHFIADIITGDWGNDTPDDGLEEVYCVRGADIPDWNNGNTKSAPIRYVNLSRQENKRFRHGDIMIEGSGGSPTQSTGRTILIRDSLINSLDKPVFCSNFSKIIRPRSEKYSIYLYDILTNLYNRGVMFHYEGKTTGIKNLLLPRLVENFMVVNPPNEILEAYNQQVAILYDRINQLGKENERLEEMRDLLIRKLIK